MPDKTANSYISDQGELVLTVTAGEVADLSVVTTAEALTFDYVLRKLEET